jgi:hypothetical protein
MMKSKTEDSESDDDSIPAGTVLASGITLPTAVCFKDAFLSTRVQISRHNRGKTVEARRKLRDRVCVKLDHTLNGLRDRLRQKQFHIPWHSLMPMWISLFLLLLTYFPDDSGAFCFVMVMTYLYLWLRRVLSE